MEIASVLSLFNFIETFTKHLTLASVLPSAEEIVINETKFLSSGIP